MTTKHMISAASIGIVAALLFIAWERDSRWNDWSADHCKPVPVIGDDPTVVSVSADAEQAYQEGKRGWWCDDGKTYWR